MYAVYWYPPYLDGPKKRIVYVPNSGEDGYMLTSAKLKRGINEAGELTIDIPRKNAVWRHPILPGGEETETIYAPDQGHIFSVEKDGKEIWRGRAISYSWDMYQNMSLTCEGLLAYFNDFLLPDYNFYWTGVISHGVLDPILGIYNPDEGLISANLNKLSGLLPDVVKDKAEELIPDAIKDKITDTIGGLTGSEDIINDLTNAVGVSLDPADDNVDRRITAQTYLLWVLVMYNSQLTNSDADKIKRISVGYIDPIFNTDSYKINRKTTEYSNCWAEIKQVVLDEFGGVMYVSNWHQNENGEVVFDPDSIYLYYYKDSCGNNSQVIQYGENLLEYEYEVDNSQRITRWYIFGETTDANGKKVIIDMGSVNDGKPFVDAGGALLGTLSGVEYTKLTTPKECYDYGVRKLEQSFWGSYSVRVEAIDLNVIDPNIDAFEPGKLSRFIMDNEIYDYSQSNQLYRLKSMSLDLLSPENSEYTFEATGLTP